MATDLIYRVDEGLDVIPWKMAGYICRPHAREDCLDKEGKFIPGSCVADQASPSLLVRVDSDG